MLYYIWTEDIVKVGKVVRGAVRSGVARRGTERPPRLAGAERSGARL